MKTQLPPTAVRTDWALAGRDLCNHGFTLVDISEHESIPRKAFDLFHRFRSRLDLPTIPAQADSAHCTGQHEAGGLSRYNQYREGWVFSDGQRWNGSAAADNMDDVWELETLLHKVAAEALAAIETETGNIPENWFQTNLGPFQNSSQWHLKKYVPPPPAATTGAPVSTAVWLPSHTDPSLVSVVILDRPGCQTNAQGLCRWETTTKEWVPIPYSGHAVAIVLVGSVLAHIMKSVQACKHCVQWNDNDGHDNDDDDYTTRNRAAATLFVRPQPQALLQSPPHQAVEKQQPMVFEEWNQRVARNYQKRR